MSFAAYPTRNEEGPLPGRLVAIVLWLLLYIPGRAALWQSQSWALTGTANAAVGYDSNLFARSNGDGDGFVEFAPSVAFRRINSLTDLRLEASCETYTFSDRRDLDSIDPALAINLRYPFDPEVFSSQELRVGVARHTEANGDVGGRLRRDDLNFHWEGTFAPSGKVTWTGRTGLERTDYVTAGYNTNEAATAGVTLNFVSNEKLQLGAGYDFESSRSRPDQSGLPDTSRHQHLYALRGRGEFLPKVTGRFFVGLAEDNYKGGDSRTDHDFAAGASMDWKINERSQVSGTGERLTYFAPTGFAATHTRLSLEWTQDIIEGLSAILGGRIEKVAFHDTYVYRRDRLYSAQLQLRYALDQRFSAELLLQYTRQNSDEAFNTYDRQVIHGSVVYQF